MEIVYGHKVENMSDPLVRLAEKAGRGTSEAVSPGSNALTALTDFFPISAPVVLPLYVSLLTARCSELLPSVDARFRFPKNDFGRQEMCSALRDRAIRGRKEANCSYSTCFAAPHH